MGHNLLNLFIALKKVQYLACFIESMFEEAKEMQPLSTL